MDKNEVSVAFDDETLSIDEVVKALAVAGYAVPGYAETPIN
jgi:copper chaperone CopZ